jgi:membrane protease YdiL (CAAX protease family)
LSPEARLWLRIGLGTTVAFALLAALSPDQPESRLPLPAEPAAGIAAGLLVYVLVTRRRPCVPEFAAPAAVIAAKYGIVALLAANEEIVWRRMVLGELLWVGAAPAVAASAVAFALAHRGRPGVHLGTGAALGSLYALSGALACCIAAHWTYNVLVSALADRSRRDRRGMSP